jgi:syntaxin 5
VAGNQALYDDRPVEIQELTYIIKQDIGTLNRNIAKLQQHALKESSAAHNKSLAVCVVGQLSHCTARMCGCFLGRVVLLPI